MSHQKSTSAPKAIAPTTPLSPKPAALPKMDDLISQGLKKATTTIAEPKFRPQGDALDQLNEVVREVVRTLGTVFVKVSIADNSTDSSLILVHMLSQHQAVLRQSRAGFETIDDRTRIEHHAHCAIKLSFDKNKVALVHFTGTVDPITMVKDNRTTLHTSGPPRGEAFGTIEMPNALAASRIRTVQQFLQAMVVAFGAKKSFAGVRLPHPALPPQPYAAPAPQA